MLILYAAAELSKVKYSYQPAAHTQNLPGSACSAGCSQLPYVEAVLVNGLSQIPTILTAHLLSLPVPK